MKKFIFSTVLMFVALFFLIVKLSSQGTSATQTPPTPPTSSLSVTKNTGTSTVSQNRTASGSMATRPQASRMTRTS